MQPRLEVSRPLTLQLSPSTLLLERARCATDRHVVAAAAQHAAASHGHEDTPELREQLRGLLEPGSAYVAGERAPEPFPS